MRFDHLRLHSSSYLEPEEFLTTDQIEEDLRDLYTRAKLPVGRLESLDIDDADDLALCEAVLRGRGG